MCINSHVSVDGLEINSGSTRCFPVLECVNLIRRFRYGGGDFKRIRRILKNEIDYDCSVIIDERYDRIRKNICGSQECIDCRLDGITEWRSNRHSLFERAVFQFSEKGFLNGCEGWLSWFVARTRNNCRFNRLWNSFRFCWSLYFFGSKWFVDCNRLCRQCQ